MANKLWRRAVPALCALCMTLLGLASARPALAQQPTTHNLTFSNASESRDAKGRIIITGKVAGDLPGFLTLALVVNSNGLITGGEWALNVSFTQFGPPSTDGDGDASEVLVQKGSIKGNIVSGNAGLGSNGLALTANGLQLQITGASRNYAAVASGKGSFTAAGLNLSTISSGSLSLTF